jgi:hypothetical protein
MLQRLEAMEQEFGTLMESLRVGSNRLSADLQLLEGNLAEVGAATLPRRSFGDEAEVEQTGVVAEGVIEAEPPGAVDGQGEPVGGEAVPEPVGASAAREETDAVPEPVGAAREESGAAPEPVSAAPEPVSAAPEPVGAAPPEMGGAPADDAEGARLIALNMALNGTPREDTDRYLAENFQLSDRGGLLDEVYASVNA